MKETAYPPQEGDHRSPDDVVVVVVDDVVDDDDDDDDDDENLNNHGGKVDIHNLHPSCDNDPMRSSLTCYQKQLGQPHDAAIHNVTVENLR